MSKEKAWCLELRAGVLLARAWFSSHRGSPHQLECGGRVWTSVVTGESWCPVLGSMREKEGAGKWTECDGVV